jgi:hypothetical protein
MRDPSAVVLLVLDRVPAGPISGPREDSEEERHPSVYAQASFEHEQEHEHEQPISQQALV